MKHTYPKTFLLLSGFFLGLVGCSPSSASVELSGTWVHTDLADSEETKYVIAVSKNCPTGQEIITAINHQIKTLNITNLKAKYVDDSSSRSEWSREVYNRFAELHLDETNPLRIMACTYVPFNYSGAFGAFTDGLDAYLMYEVAKEMNRQPYFFDVSYDAAYQGVKKGKSADVLISGISYSEQLSSDFLLSDVYLTGKQQIISDQNQSFTKLSQLSGLKIGVVKGRDGERLVSDAIKTGVLKDKGSEMITYYSDTDAQSDLHSEMVDVLVMDECPAEILVNKENK